MLVTDQPFVASTVTHACLHPGASKYSARCAGVVLAAWTTVWRHSSPTDLNLSVAFRDAGAYDGSVLGWADPAHANAALAALTTQASTLFQSGSSGQAAAPSLHSLVLKCAKPMAVLESQNAAKAAKAAAAKAAAAKATAAKVAAVKVAATKGGAANAVKVASGTIKLNARGGHGVAGKL